MRLADLHVHTALSPCAEDEMTPPAIVEAARMAGLEIVGICDHNSAENVAAVMEAGDGQDVVVVGGVEVQTREDVHVLTFLPDIESLLEWQHEVYATLPDIENDEARFGGQLVMDSSGRVVARLKRLLLASTSMSIDYVGRRVRELGGLVVPAHVDRPSFSLLRNLGFVPSGLAPDCIEVSSRTGAKQARELYPELSGFPIIVSSDAHRLDEIAGYTGVYIGRPSFDELRLAFESAGGRCIMPTCEDA